MNNQYEENQRSYSNNRQSRFDSTFERKEFNNSSKERTTGNTYYPSPYAAKNNEYSVSPNRNGDQRDYNEIEETIQGNIDG